MSGAAVSPPKGLPFGLSQQQPVFDRVTEMATTMMGAYASALAIVHQGRMWRTADPEGRLPRTSRLAETVIITGEPLWVEDLTVHPLSRDHPMVSGSKRLRAYAGVPIKSAAGDVIGVLSVICLSTRAFDPAKQKLLEQLAQFVADECARQRGALELEETQAALGAFLTTVPASMSVMDTELRILQASPAWLDTFSLTLEEARGRSILEIAPDYYAPFREAYERCLTGESVHGAKVSAPLRDGQVRYLRADLRPWRNSRGEIGGVVAASVDITDMVEALDRTERAKVRLQLAVEIADLHVWELDYVNRTLETDGVAETFFDEPIDERAFMRDTSITIDPRDRERISEEWRIAVEEDRPFRPEYRIARKDGREVWATCTVKLLRDEAGQATRLIGAMQNITERKLQERELLRAKDEAEAANRAKSTFLATMSHEIRTPLNGVLGMAQAMAAEPLSEAQRDRLSIIRQSGETLLTILNDVLDLSKIEAGKLELEAIEFDLTALAASAESAFRGLAAGKGLGLTLCVDPAAAGRYRSDATRIRQILFNLLSNALKFTEAGEVSLSVSRDRAGALVFEVADTGAGMNPELLGRLFQKFEQADASTTRRFGGTGLGLAICRELAGLLGGAVEAESEEGRGSVFRLTLPLERLGDEAGEVRQDGREGPAVAGQLKVLAAEDNPVNQLVLKTLLGQAGVEPVVVPDGAAALAAWRAEPWDLILMDVQMPVMDGPAATRAIRAEEAAAGRARTPVVALTANAMSHQIAEYAAAGMDGFVAKPIDAGKLFDAMAQALAEAEGAEAA